MRELNNQLRNNEKALERAQQQLVGIQNLFGNPALQ